MWPQEEAKESKTRREMEGGCKKTLLAGQAAIIQVGELVT